MAAIAKNGSPLLLNAVGRAFGLGTDEQQALVTGQIPWWLIGVVGVAVGAFACYQADKVGVVDFIKNGFRSSEDDEEEEALE